MSEQKSPEIVLEGGTYEILRKRLQDHAERLRGALDQLNTERRRVFGSVERKLLATQRITTAYNCIPRDIIALGDKFIFAYNVHFGLKATTELSDVFSIYRLNGEGFEEAGLEVFGDEQFQTEFQGLYKYYKNTIFTRFWRVDPYFYMIFRIGKATTDVKAFKWLVKPDQQLEYQDNRSDHEYRYPSQHGFEWTRTNRDYHREGKHPHVSIEDRVFVECVGGDITIKIEDNTETGEGILADPVDDMEQKLDDAEILYASLGPLILLKVKPYREPNYRYYVYNEKVQDARRIDSIGECCLPLPDNQGIIFPTGYYLITGEYKHFGYEATDMLFERRIQSPNGEDTLFVFYNREHGNFILLSYNLIEQAVQTPIHCNGYCFFRDGQLLYFRSENEPQKHHSVQIWQTPYTSSDYKPPVSGESALVKIGNKELVRAMAECQNVINLANRDAPYETLYDDIYRFASGMLDSYFWIGWDEVFNLKGILADIRDSASAAVDEFNKVKHIRRATAEQLGEVRVKTDEFLSSANADLFDSVEKFIGALAELRLLRSSVIGLSELRYVNQAQVEEMKTALVEKEEELSGGCVAFLLQPGALSSYEQMVASVSERTADLKKTIEAKEIEEEIARIAREVETMIDVVGNLRIEDPEKSTQIIECCSDILTRLNTVRADLKNRKKSIQTVEASGQFTAQLRLLEQSIVSHIDLAGTPEKCDEYQNRLLVQVEELEGKYADFDDYVIELVDKRGDITEAFDARRHALLEEKNRRIETLQKSADRILNAVRARVNTLQDTGAIRAYFAADMMVEKARNLIAAMTELGDTVKADEIQNRLKTIEENAIRQLRDKQELYGADQNTIRFGRHAFSVNRQKPDLTFLVRDGDMYVHVTGTNFMEKVKDAELNETRSVWDQEYISESKDVYRAEYLAFSMIRDNGAAGLPSKDKLVFMDAEDILPLVQKYMGPRFEEGYKKGVHDVDAAIILGTLLGLYHDAGLLRYESAVRALARFYWYRVATEKEKRSLHSLLRGIGAAVRQFGERPEFDLARRRLKAHLDVFIESTGICDSHFSSEAANYLFEELAQGGGFVISPEAAEIHDQFLLHLKDSHHRERLDDTLAVLDEDIAAAVQLLRGWMNGFLRSTESEFDSSFVDEAAALILTDSFTRAEVCNAHVKTEVTGLKGTHSRINDGKLIINFPEFMGRLGRFERVVVPLYRQMKVRKKSIAESYREDLRLRDFEPRVLTSFVRNQLINEVYLPLIGDNLAKQIGAAGAEKRTDLMGMLLLLSPPGYGKTTLMEYIASRLGVIFIKINGPVLGHRTLSLDPGDAPNAAAREEVEKLNLAFEMGDNIMIYLDDIQHCSAEFLQKFISLCDGQRRIDGVWKGKSRTYDLRGRKVSVVMAGNPYTESGEKFQIPDMLANRADTYNLGDILGDYEKAFETSYIENCLTSNSILKPLALRSQKDIYALIILARTGPQANIEFEGNYSVSEINDFVSVLKKLFRVQEVILKVNREYIRSAAQEDAYRTEPPFKLQGSYRNMNKLAERIVPVMNDEELESLIISHYESEAQTLTSAAEASLLKFRELMGILSPDDKKRWEAILDTFRRRQRHLGMDAENPMTRAVAELSDLTHGVGVINERLGVLGELSSRLGEAGPRLSESLALFAEQSAKSHDFPKEFSTTLSDETRAFLTKIVEQMGARPEGKSLPSELKMDLSDSALDRLAKALGELRLKAEFPTAADAMETVEKFDKNRRGEFIAIGSMRECFEQNGFAVKELAPGSFEIQRDNARPILLRVRNDRLQLRMRFDDATERLGQPLFIQRILKLNSEILPVSFAIEQEDGNPVLQLVETRDGKDLTRSELISILQSMEAAARRAEELFKF